MPSNENKKSPGGLLVGLTDKNGGQGIKVIAPEGDIGMGGAEIIIVSDASKAKEKYEFEGEKKTPCEILSDINQKYKGVAIPCDIAEEANTTDSKMEVGDVIKNKTTMAQGGDVSAGNIFIYNIYEDDKGFVTLYFNEKEFKGMLEAHSITFDGGVDITEIYENKKYEIRTFVSSLSDDSKIGASNFAKVENELNEVMEKNLTDPELKENNLKARMAFDTYNYSLRINVTGKNFELDEYKNERAGGGSMASGGKTKEKYHWKKRPDGSFGVYNENGLQVTVFFSKEAALGWLEKANDTKNYEISNQQPVKKSKYKLGDKVYSWQNKDYPAEVVRRQFSPWTSEHEPHENDKWKYLVRLKDGQRSKWMSEPNLHKTQQKEYAEGGSMAKGGYVPSQEVMKGQMVLNPETNNNIKVIQKSVAGRTWIITGENENGGIESFTDDWVNVVKSSGGSMATGGGVPLLQYKKEVNRISDLRGLKVYDKRRKVYGYLQGLRIYDPIRHRHEDIDDDNISDWNKTAVENPSRCEVFVLKTKDAEYGWYYPAEDFMVVDEPELIKGGSMASGGKVKELRFNTHADVWRYRGDKKEKDFFKKGEGIYASLIKDEGDHYIAVSSSDDSLSFWVPKDAVTISDYQEGRTMASGGKTSFGYYIYVTPQNKNFKPHVWVEGGWFPTEESAEFHARQMRKQKQPHDRTLPFYEKVEVIPATAKERAEMLIAENKMASGGRVKEEDVTDMIWELKNNGRQSFTAPENIEVAETLVERGLAVREGNEYGLTKNGEQEFMASGGKIKKGDTLSKDGLIKGKVLKIEFDKDQSPYSYLVELENGFKHYISDEDFQRGRWRKINSSQGMEEGGHVPQSRIEDTDKKNSQCNCPTMAYHNRLSETQREKLGDKYLAEGSQITDHKTNLTSEIAEIEHNGFRLRPQSAFNGAPRQEFVVPFDEVIDRHESRDISINGYSNANLEDHKILILVVKDIMACNIIKGKDQKIHELSERADMADYFENKLHRRRMEAGGFVYETGANFDKVNGLILFADTTRNLAEMRDAVKATIKSRMAKGAAPTRQQLEDRFKTFLLKVRGQYIREMGNTEDAREEADLTPEEEKDFLRVYAEDAWIGTETGKLGIDPDEAKSMQYWNGLNTKSKLSFLLDNAEDVFGEPLKNVPKAAQADYKKMANAKWINLPKGIHLALLEHVIKKTYETGGELDGYESSNNAGDEIEGDIKSTIDGLIVLLDCTEDEGQRANIIEELAGYGHHAN